MNATKARAMVDDFESVDHSENILDRIAHAARRGQRFVDVDVSDMTRATQRRLKELDYFFTPVHEHDFGMRRAGKKFRVSW